MRLFLVLGLVLGSLAGTKAHTPRLLHTGGRSFILPVTRRSHSLTLVNDSAPNFDPQFVQNEIRRLLLKYQQAHEFLPSRGVELGKSVSVQDAFAPIAGGVRSSLSDSESKSVFPSLDVTSPPAESGQAVHTILPPSRTARVPLTDFIQNRLDILYYADIKIGTPPQSFTVDIDTGSADLFIPSNCAGDECGNHKQFNSKASTTFVKQAKTIKLSYGSGDAEGDLGQDVVSMQGLTVRNQSFIAVSSESSDFKDEPNDGLIGMGFSSIAESKSPTFFENLIQTQAIAEPEFSLHLSRGHVSGSELCLGCFNSARAIGPSKYFPVVSKSYWTLAMDGLAINSTMQPANGVVAAIDSGTTLIYVPAELAASFYSLIPGSRQVTDMGPSFYAYPCVVQFTPSIVFGMQHFAINMTDFNLGRLSGESSECMGGVIALPNGFPSSLAIVGDEFLKSWYTTFDYSHGARVGFAPSVNNRL